MTSTNRTELCIIPCFVYRFAVYSMSFIHQTTYKYQNRAINRHIRQCAAYIYTCRLIERLCGDVWHLIIKHMVSAEECALLTIGVQTLENESPLHFL